MDMDTQVQILDEVVGISHRGNTLGEGMYQLFLPLGMVK